MLNKSYICRKYLTDDLFDTISIHLGLLSDTCQTKDLKFAGTGWLGAGRERSHLTIPRRPISGRWKGFGTVVSQRFKNQVSDKCVDGMAR
jgi:hypothetical protein